jgi:LacI family transcriptional regulator
MILSRFFTEHSATGEKGRRNRADILPTVGHVKRTRIMARTRRSKVRHVALLIESSRAAGRNILDGVSRYIRERTSWVTYFEPRGLEDSVPRWLSHWHGDGILARIATPALAEAIRATRLPAIDLRDTLQERRFFQILGDNARIAQLAFTHLKECGLRHFGFCGLAPGLHRNQDLRRQEFQHLVEQAGFPCSGFHYHPHPSDWDRSRLQMAAWLRALPKPVGILACYDDCGYQILEASHLAGLQVPEEVAILGMDNDPVMCSLTLPPLSSIDVNGALIGYEAAAWLDRLMDGCKPPPSPVLIEPRGVVARRSTDILAWDDPEVCAAVRFIQEHACEGIRVSDVLKVVSLSQTALEQRFHQHLGRTPKAELLRVKIERACQLLGETDLPLKNIASLAGFSSEKYFSYAFLHQTGISPTAYRKRRRYLGS